MKKQNIFEKACGLGEDFLTDDELLEQMQQEPVEDYFLTDDELDEELDESGPRVEYSKLELELLAGILYGSGWSYEDLVHIQLRFSCSEKEASVVCEYLKQYEDQELADAEAYNNEYLEREWWSL